ncbi:MAG TPA: hypothetical protein VF848_09825 [Steroidobacteraceae bacterium]
MRLTLASGRGLLAGWLLAHTFPLLISHQEIGAWSAMGLGDRLRIGLAAIELLGAVLFAFEATVTTGLALLLTAFVIAALIHVRQGQVPWWLAGYALAAVLLRYFSRRAAPAAASGTAAR